MSFFITQYNERSANLVKTNVMYFYDAEHIQHFPTLGVEYRGKLYTLYCVVNSAPRHGIFFDLARVCFPGIWVMEFPGEKYGFETG